MWTRFERFEFRSVWTEPSTTAARPTVASVAGGIAGAWLGAVAAVLASAVWALAKNGMWWTGPQPFAWPLFGSQALGLGLHLPSLLAGPAGFALVAIGFGALLGWAMRSWDVTSRLLIALAMGGVLWFLGWQIVETVLWTGSMFSLRPRWPVWLTLMLPTLPLLLAAVGSAWADPTRRRTIRRGGHSEVAVS